MGFDEFKSLTDDDLNDDKKNYVKCKCLNKKVISKRVDQNLPFYKRKCSFFAFLYKNSYKN